MLRLIRDVARRKGALLGGIMLFVLVLIALMAPWLTPYNPTAQDLRLRLLPPLTPEHPLGTDELGRDILTRIIFGSRVSLLVGACSVLLGLVLGTLIGITSGYFGQRYDTVMMRLMDVMMTFPTLLLAIAIVATLGGGMFNLMLAIGISNIPRFARLVRGEALRLRNLDYVEAARAAGASNGRIMLRYMLPNLLSALIVMITLRVGVAILVESSLAYLGLGVPPPTPTWGGMVSRGQRFLLFAPWMSLVPGTAIMILVFSINLFGDGLRDALDPQLRGDQAT
ncbi:MAG: ABC transporter permease [Bacillota bacterium]|nr:MAG: ABC transporter permease [Bacillota bacterium]